MPEVGLQRSRVMPSVRQSETASMPQHADRVGYFGGVIVPPLRFWCGARRYAHLTHLDCAVGVPFLRCCYR